MDNLNDVFSVRGDVVIHKTNEFGIVEERKFKNLVVAVGKSHMISRMSANTVNVMSHLAVGTGSTAAISSDTSLQTELARVALTVAGGTPSSNTVSYSATLPAGTGTGALTEAGIFNNPSANTGVMLCRSVFPVINKGASDTMTVSWVISIL